ncbi:Fic family protein [Hyphomonas sp. UBA5107]|jgi:Fic family protein|uniref:Fic family protein n=1 Tax=Hyphomonas sp. UBA5107 TaxID=1946636 RepID=UPI0039C8B63E|tara:strand:+ start:277 stop:525 length:249 start_codon:yes stop_codon:yes gene_type:complete
MEIDRRLDCNLKQRNAEKVATHSNLKLRLINVLSHLSARPEDLLAFDNQDPALVDAIVAAAVLAFGCVYIHPFEDRNGRFHR